MRQGPLPPLRDLPVGEPIERCEACGALVLARDRCKDVGEVAICLGDPVAVGATYGGAPVGKHRHI